MHLIDFCIPVKDLLLQEPSQSQNIPFPQETPMKPSQIPNRFPHPPLRRTLPLQTPEQCYRDQQGYSMTMCHPPQPHGPHSFPGFGCFSPMNNGHLVNGRASVPPSQPIHLLGPVQRCQMTTPQPQPTPNNHFQNWYSTYGPSTDMSISAPFFHTTGEPPAKSTNTLPSPENKPLIGQDLNKVFLTV